MKKTASIGLILLAIAGCSKSGTTTTTPATPTTSTAPPAADQLATFAIGDHTYYIIKAAKTWAAAAAYAKQYGGYLAEIGDKTEQDAIAAQFEKNGLNAKVTSATADGGGARYVWIGATDRTAEGTWVWDGNGTGTSTKPIGTGKRGFTNAFGGDESKWTWVAASGVYNNWGQGSAANEPDNYNEIQDFGAMTMEDYPTAAFASANSYPPAIVGNIGKKYQWNDLADKSGNADISLFFIVEVGAR